MHKYHLFIAVFFCLFFVGGKEVEDVTHFLIGIVIIHFHFSEVDEILHGKS